MTECPLNTRCVSRNFCDDNGMVTATRHNDLNFEEDKRGFIACVDSSRNVLGVCCVELQTILQGEGGPIRQDDVFTVRIKFFFLILPLNLLVPGLHDNGHDEQEDKTYQRSEGLQETRKYQPRG